MSKAACYSEADKPIDFEIQQLYSNINAITAAARPGPFHEMVSNVQELACDAEPADNEIVECNVLLAF
jgi:hypothetical protein